MKKQTNKTEDKNGIELKKKTILTFENMKNVNGGGENTCKGTDEGGRTSDQGGV